MVNEWSVILKENALIYLNLLLRRGNGVGGGGGRGANSLGMNPLVTPSCPGLAGTSASRGDGAFRHRDEILAAGS